VPFYGVWCGICDPIGLIVKGMRVLRYVGPGSDDRHLLLETADGGEQFSLVISDELRIAAGTDLPRLGTPRLRESPISPREIQVRVRSGETPQDIAQQADIPLERVLRFAAAVVQERIRITGEARNSRSRRNTADGEMVIFGEHVDSRFAAHGIAPDSVAWDSYRSEDGQWIVSAGWHGGDLNRVARWTFALQARLVTPIDETAADLLSDRPIRPVVHVVYDLPISNPSDATTGPIPVVGGRDELFDQEAQAAQQAEEERVPVAAVPMPPLRLAEPLPGMPTGGRPPVEYTESDEEHAARAHIPSWDDILLGVRRKND